MRTVFDPVDDAAADRSPGIGHGAPPAPCCPDAPGCGAAARGSRRRRLWELGHHAHCPVVGLGLPVAVLRRLMQRHGSGASADDYEMHGQGVGAARSRNPLSESLQRELDTRHAQALRQAGRLKSAQALGEWWQQQRHGPQMPGALWALLTHARCTTELEDQVLGEVHMQQHEVGQLARALAERQQQLQAQQVRLEHEHASMAARLDEQRIQAAQERERLQADLVKTRGQVLSHQTRVEQLEAELAGLRQAQPDLPARLALSQQLGEQAARLRELQRALDRAQDDKRRLRDERAAAVPAAGAAPADPADPAVEAAGMREALRSRAVLCVGGRTGAVPVYRQVVESAGAQFLHHDGGDEDNVQRLEHNLAAADLVICQTGCISHDAYWRVKDHCRRTGKRCVFVEQPSASSLQRALCAAGKAGTEVVP